MKKTGQAAGEDASLETDRRTILKLACSSVLAFGVAALGCRSGARNLEATLADLERQSGGRLGVCVVDLHSGETAGHRDAERFGMCSTFKLLLAAIILIEAQKGRIDLDAQVHFTQDDMVPYAPVTQQRLEAGFMSVVQLAEATQTTSDNVAANLLLDLIGGPTGFTGKLRGIGDELTRLDRYEPEMNLVMPGEVRDTTTPAAMAATVRRLLSGSLLSNENRAMLRSWMESTRTGLDRLRAGFPTHWSAGDKTGTGIADGMPNKYNDVAAAWPQDGVSAFVVTAYYESDDHYDTVRERDVAVLKKVGEVVSSAVVAGAILP